MKVLFIGDVVGGPGRRGLAATMPELRERFAPKLVIVNGENSAGGMGITDELAIGAGHKRLLVLSRWPESPLATLDRYAGVLH